MRAGTSTGWDAEQAAAPQTRGLPTSGTAVTWGHPNCSHSTQELGEQNQEDKVLQPWSRGSSCPTEGLQDQLEGPSGVGL